MKLRARVALILSTLALVGALGAVVPPYWQPMVVLSILATETAGPILVIAAIGGLLGAIDWRRRAARTAIVFAVLAAILTAIPFARFRQVDTQFDSAMRSALGRDYLERIPPALRYRMRPKPLVVRDLFFGVPSKEVQVTRRIRFADPGGVPLLADVYQPALRGTYPIVVTIYGGAWRSGSPGDEARAGRYWASHGYVAVAIDYRHLPRWTWPAQIADVRTALAWVRDHGAEYGGDVSRLALVGQSAGAHLAMLAAYEPGAPKVRAVIDLYGPVDLIAGYRDPPTPDPADVRFLVKALFGSGPDREPERWREASPMTYATHPQPPTLLIYGGRDHLVLARYGRRMYERLRATGTTAVFLEIPWAEHAFDFAPIGLSGQLSLFYMERFLGWAMSNP